MGKTFETQIKAIGEQSQKQIKAIQIQGHVKTIKKFPCDNEDTPFVSKQKEIFHKLVGEKVEKITDLDKRVNSDDLIYKCKSNTADSWYC